MRSFRYNIAATLDGYVAGPNGEFDPDVTLVRENSVDVVKRPSTSGRRRHPALWQRRVVCDADFRRSVAADDERTGATGVRKS
ncbi:MAG: hypothetical protein ABI442_08495 [Gemmatimonadaceae bacterium]